MVILLVVIVVVLARYSGSNFRIEKSADRLLESTLYLFIKAFALFDYMSFFLKLVNFHLAVMFIVEFGIGFDLIVVPEIRVLGLGINDLIG